MGPRFLAFHRPRRAGGPRFLARAGAIFSRNRMNVRPISVEGGFAMISRHEGLDLGALRTLSSRFSLGNRIPILMHSRSGAPTPYLAATAPQTLTCSTATTRCSTRDLSTS